MKGASYRNPLRRWLASQPLEVSITSFAQDIGYHRGHTTTFFQEGCTRMPNWGLAVRLAKRTGGVVTPQEICDFVAANKRRLLAREAA